MIWTEKQQYHPYPFEKEAELESAIASLQSELFGDQRIYLNVKKLIGQAGMTRNIPDGYLIDLTSPKKPMLYLVEVELASHDPLRHIAQQLLEFSLSFKSTPQKMKGILRDALHKNPDALKACVEYATRNNFDNIDFLLEAMIHREDGYNALVIIDELQDELESIVRGSLRFPVETLTVARFKSSTGEAAYHFEPFLYDMSLQAATVDLESGNSPSMDPAEIDTIVVPAREEGFRNVFLGENCWYAIRIHPSKIAQINHIAAYQVAPESAITYVADVVNIEPWKDTGKYILRFSGPAQKIAPIKLVPGGKASHPQSPRYTSLAKIQGAKNLDDVF
jgi:hypothetical protein